MHFFGQIMEKNMSRPPAATSDMVYFKDNNIIIIGREDGSIQIYGVHKDIQVLCIKNELWFSYFVAGK